MTNEEKLKSMSTGNLAVWLKRNTHSGYCKFCMYNLRGSGCTSRCIAGISEWLESEADDGKKVKIQS